MFYESPRCWGIYHSFVIFSDLLLVLYLFTVSSVTVQFHPSIKELAVPGSVTLCNKLTADNRIILSVICYILQKH